VALPGSADLHTAAHEAAHVVQAAEGVHASGGLAGDDLALERHADAVADAVEEGRSAEGLLDRPPRGAGGGTPTVQRIISVSGSYYTRPDTNKLKLLNSGQQQSLQLALDDRTQKHDFAKEDDIYAFFGGDNGKAPKTTPIDNNQLQGAQKRKNDEAFDRNTERIGELTDSTAFHDLPKGQLPVWKTMDGPEGLVFKRNEERKKHELRVRKEKKDVNKLSNATLTTYQEKTSGKLQWHANMGVDLSSSYTDPTVSSKPTSGSDRDSAMGGFSSSTGDFKDTHDDETHTIGHSTAYKHHMQLIEKKRKVDLGTGGIGTEIKNGKTPDQDPLAFTPENMYVGQHIRRMEVEGISNKNNGSYMEANEIGKNPRKVKTGKKIPDRKHYMRQGSGKKEYASFDQFDDWKTDSRSTPDWKTERENQGGMHKLYESQIKPLSSFPQEEYYESSKQEKWPSLLDCPPSPQYLPEFYQTDYFDSKVELQPGTSVDHKGLKWVVGDLNDMKMASGGLVYTYVIHRNNTFN